MFKKKEKIVPGADICEKALDKAEKQNTKAEEILENYGFGLDVAEGVLSGLSCVPIPGLGAVCGKLKEVIGAARRVEDLAEDALEMTESVVELGKYMVDLSKQADRLSEEIKQELEAQLKKLSKVIENMSEALDKFGKKGFFKAMFRAGKSAKSFAKIDKKKERIMKAIQSILQKAQLGLQMDMKERQYALECAISTKLEEVLKKSGIERGEEDDDDVNEAAEEILKNPQDICEVAKSAKMSEDVFRAELGEMKQELQQMGMELEGMMTQYQHALTEQLKAGFSDLSAQNTELQKQLAILKQQIEDKENAATQQRDEMRNEMRNEAAKNQQNQQQMMEMLQKALLAKDTSAMGEKEMGAMTKLVEAQVLTNNGDDAAAKEKVEEATKLHRSAESELSRGQVLQREEKWSEAVVAYKHAVELDPDLAGAWFGIGYTLGQSIGEKETAAEGVAAYHECVRIDPTHAWAHYNLGVLLMNHMQQYPEAEAAYRAAIAANPKHADAHYNLGLLLKNHMQQYPEAEAAYRAAIAADPKHASAHYGLGNLLKNHMQQYPEAEAAYRAAIAADPKYADANYNLAILLEFKLQKYPEAEAAYLATLAIKPTHACRYWLANMLGNKLGRWADAAVHMRLAAEGGDTNAKKNLAQCEEKAAQQK
jgi:tetratricopeptide (TPR) repeat protein